MPMQGNTHKTPKRQDSESFWVVEHMEVLGGWCVQRRHGDSAPSPLMPHPMYLFHWLVLSCILDNKLVIASKALS